ncbi:MAG: Fe(3+) dicitrate transport protein [Lentimonas sp.]|jgi:Fe(3+) dicitrate transport protein
MNFSKLSTASILILSLSSAHSFAKTTTLTTIVVKEKSDDESNVQYQIPVNFAGSASYVSPEDIEKKQSFDINRLVREIPGVNITEEDGYGLRPNIGLRGGRSNRSADITLMEDGVLIAPAPYSAPDAYYFPSMGRVKGIEVRKGSSAIKYGPRTTSGALNLLTTPIPDSAKGNFKASIGSFGEKNLNFNYGTLGKHFGYVVNFDHSSSDGFKELDGGGDTGYELNDFMGKFRLKTEDDADIYQHLEFKIAMNDEISNETYVGLSLADFNENPYRRYKASALDEMDAQHRQYQMSHYIEPTDDFNVTTTVYRNEFDRNWYKLDRVNGNKIADAFIKTDLTDLNTLKGIVDGNLSVKNNNRQYVSQGIQSNFKNELKVGNVRHNLEYGARYHTDEEFRSQHSDTYTMTSGQIQLSAPGTPGSEVKLAKADAFSIFLEDEIILGQLTIIPGIRYENLRTTSTDYINNKFSENSEDQIIPGIASSYLLTENFAVFGGVHKGFAPPSPSNSNADAEESVNYELGLRFKDKVKFFESVVFYNDYSNLLGTDTASVGGTGSGDQFNGGEVTAYGLEVAAGIDLKANILKQSFKFPISVSYTFNHAEFGSSFKGGISEWGDVEKGDKLPYIAEHQFGLNAGIEVGDFAFYLSNKFVDAMRAEAGTGEIPKDKKIPAHFITDFSAFYEFQKDRKIFVAVDNVFDRQYAVSLRPAGLRPGKPMTARIGVSIGF